MSQLTITVPSEPVLAKIARKLRGMKLQPLDRMTKTTGHKLIEAKVHYRGQTAHLLVRENTTDADLVRMVFYDQCMYQLPATVEPSIVFDCGANIGVTAAYFAMTYPNATVYCFEPLPENLELLQENVAAFGDRIQVLPFGLSKEVGSFTYNMSADPKSFGGGTFCNLGCDPERAKQLPVRTVGDVMDDLGIDHVDVFKLDTEGSELPILEGTPPAIYRNAQALVGELHGSRDWDFCKLIDPTHSIGMEKPYARRCFEFVAIRRDLI